MIVRCFGGKHRDLVNRAYASGKIPKMRVSNFIISNMS